MAVADVTRCPRCGSPRPTRGPSNDLCPACLLTAALSLEDEPCPYRVLAPMADGCDSVTYLAQALTGTRGHVALKIYDHRDDVDAILSRWNRWKPILDAVCHASIPRLLGVALTADGLLYVATEYVTGWPMTTLAARAPISIDARTMMARQIAEAIAAAHAGGAAHLTLEGSKIKISTAQGPHAALLGLGSSLIVDSAEPRQELDVLALFRVVRELGVSLPERQYDSAAAIAAEIANIDVGDCL